MSNEEEIVGGGWAVPVVSHTGDGHGCLLSDAMVGVIWAQ